MEAKLGFDISDNRQAHEYIDKCLKNNVKIDVDLWATHFLATPKNRIPLLTHNYEERKKHYERHYNFLQSSQINGMTLKYFGIPHYFGEVSRSFLSSYARLKKSKKTKKMDVRKQTKEQTRFSCNSKKLCEKDEFTNRDSNIFNFDDCPGDCLVHQDQESESGLWSEGSQCSLSDRKEGKRSLKYPLVYPSEAKFFKQKATQSYEIAKEALKVTKRKSFNTEAKASCPVYLPDFHSNQTINSKTQKEPNSNFVCKNSISNHSMSDEYSSIGVDCNQNLNIIDNINIDNSQKSSTVQTVRILVPQSPTISDSNGGSTHNVEGGHVSESPSYDTEIQNSDEIEVLTQNDCHEMRQIFKRLGSNASLTESKKSDKIGTRAQDSSQEKSILFEHLASHSEESSESGKSEKIQSETKDSSQESNKLIKLFGSCLEETFETGKSDKIQSVTQDSSQERKKLFQCFGRNSQLSESEKSDKIQLVTQDSSQERRKLCKLFNSQSELSESEKSDKIQSVTQDSSQERRILFKYLASDSGLPESRKPDKTKSENENSSQEMIKLSKNLSSLSEFSETEKSDKIQSETQDFRQESRKLGKFFDSHSEESSESGKSDKIQSETSQESNKLIEFFDSYVEESSESGKSEEIQSETKDSSQESNKLIEFFGSCLEETSESGKSDKIQSVTQDSSQERRKLFQCFGRNSQLSESKKSDTIQSATQDSSEEGRKLCELFDSHAELSKSGKSDKISVLAQDSQQKSSTAHAHNDYLPEQNTPKMDQQDRLPLQDMTQSTNRDSNDEFKDKLLNLSPTESFDMFEEGKENSQSQSTPQSGRNKSHVIDRGTNSTFRSDEMSRCFVQLKRLSMDAIDRQSKANFAAIPGQMDEDVPEASPKELCRSARKKARKNLNRQTKVNRE